MIIRYKSRPAFSSLTYYLTSRHSYISHSKFKTYGPAYTYGYIPYLFKDLKLDT